MDQYTRRIIGFAVHAGSLNGASVSSDNDPIFQFYRWKANLRIYEIKEIKSLPYSPISHPFIERLIRTCRNEMLDRIFFFERKRLTSKA